MKRNLRWLKLDNAAKIYPAARRRNWSNVFRVSAYFKENIKPEILQNSLASIIKRFPSICVRVRAGTFWYYVEEINEPPEISEESECPCSPMRLSDIKKCAFRVIYYKNRISVEFFHALTDGNGGLLFLKNLCAKYVFDRYGKVIPEGNGVLDLNVRAKKEELEDSFLKYSGNICASRKDTNAYRIKGKKEPRGKTHLITGEISVDEIKKKAKEYNVSITAYLTAIMIYAIQEMQEKEIEKQKLRKPIKVLIPVNLRNFYDSKSLRNFVLFITPSIEAKMGHYTFDEIIKIVHHQMGLELTEKNMNARMATNVRDEKNPILRIAPLFIKNIAMKFVYNMVGERKSCITISNLGNVQIPNELEEYIERFDFVLGMQATLPSNCSVISYKGKMHICFVRNINESELEQKFFSQLVKNGIHVKIESNSQN